MWPVASAITTSPRNSAAAPNSPSRISRRPSNSIPATPKLTSGWASACARKIATPRRARHSPNPSSSTPTASGPGSNWKKLRRNETTRDRCRQCCARAAHLFSVPRPHLAPAGQPDLRPDPGTPARPRGAAQRHPGAAPPRRLYPLRRNRSRPPRHHRRRLPRSARRPADRHPRARHLGPPADGIPILEYPGFEADDVIGTLARRAEALGMDVVIVSSDKDMLQLVDQHVSMLNPAKDDEWYDADKVKTFMGVRPDQVADLLALKGDAVDNIPGAPGIGDKGAKDLIERFGSLDAALARAGEVEKKTYRESLQNNVERIKMSQRLATIATDVPVEFSAEAVKAQAPDPALLKAIYQEMEFHSLLKELGPSEDTRERQYGVMASD